MIGAADGSLFLGTDASGVYRSTDGGGSWVQRNSGLLDMNVWSLALEPDGHIIASTFLAPNEGLAYSPADASPVGRLFRSTDLGRSWVLVDTTGASARLLVNSLGYIWKDIYSDDYSGLLRSTNGGTSWSSQMISGGGFTGSVAMDSSNNLYLGALYVTVEATKGIYKSTNSGANWTSLTASIAPNALAFKVGGYLFAGSTTSVARLTTTGTGYVVLDNSWGATSFAITSGGDVFATATDGSVRRSTDNGVNWTTVMSASKNARRIFCPTGTDLFLSSQAYMLSRSTNGSRWETVTTGIHNAFIPSLYYSPDNILYVGTPSFLWRTDGAGSSWSSVYNVDVRVEDYIREQANSYPPHTAWAITGGDGSFVATVNQSQSYASGGVSYEDCHGFVHSTSDDWANQQVARTGYSGGNPPPAATQSPLEPYAAVVGKGDTVYVAGKPMGGLNRSFGKFKGGAYTALNGPLNGKTVYALAKTTEDTLFAGTLAFGVFRSGTHGTTWAVASAGLPDLDVFALATDPDGRIFAGTGSGLFISKNNGSTWTAAPSFPSVRVQAIATNSAGHVYVATTDYVWVSGSHGAAPWYRLNTGLPIADISSLAMGPNNDVFVGTWGYGVYHRPAWPNAPSIPALAYPADLATNIPQNPVMRWKKVAGAETYQLQVSTSSSFLAMAVDDSMLTDTSRAVVLPSANNYYWRVRAKNVAGSSAYAAPWKFASIATSVTIDPNVPAEFFLAQNHPNPFNPSTRIEYGLPVRTTVRIAVYNTLGQQVAVLKGEEQEAGYHEVTFDARTMSSGVYLCRMEAGSFVQVRKLVLVR